MGLMYKCDNCQKIFLVIAHEYNFTSGKIFKNYIWGHMCICVPSMKFLCLNPWLGEVYTDNTNDDDAQRTKHDCTRLFG